MGYKCIKLILIFSNKLYLYFSTQFISTMADYKKVIRILSEAKTSVALELKDDPHALRIDTGLTHMVNHLSLLTGNDAEAKSAVKIGNATSIAGEPIAKKETVKAEDLDPKDDKVAELKEAVDKVYAGFLNDTNSELLKLDKTVLRGVAKKAGLQDYKDAVLNSKYMDKVKAAIKKEAANLQERIDQAQAKVTDLTKQIGELEEAGGPLGEVNALEVQLQEAMASLTELQNQQ